jgi:serine phosphatase RsbU (regulator of sigma subunit)
VEYEQRSLQLQPGDRIYLYSDGVPEAMDKDQEPYGDEKMAACIAGGRGGPLEKSVAGLLEAVEEWCRPAGPLDDVTILGVEWKP